MRHQSFFKALLCIFCSYSVQSFVPTTQSSQCFSSPTASENKIIVALHGWFDNFWQTPETSSSSRQIEYPEQYPATYEPNTASVEGDAGDENKEFLRQLLKNTQLESRPVVLAYDANKNGWTAQAFHRAVDGKGASIVLATTSDGRSIGGYNPKGWASLGGARPSVASFLFYTKSSDKQQQQSWQKLQKVGGGGLACAKDDPDCGVWFGPDALVIPLLDDGSNRIAQSKLGPYFERGPGNLPSLFSGGSTELKDLKIYVGVYDSTEEIPYSGGVLDMTSG
ncbi:unnamed protein product [Cylindrotheca closterium]|uniref:TLDc domain-containing protein n=1 Tax=Cylindrotheca closterium TaxID=2856 RepID=A0AAD2PUB5_9STRA|nr:unnamed protein product [Cylindrotheca closterium]